MTEKDNRQKRISEVTFKRNHIRAILRKIIYCNFNEFNLLLEHIKYY